MESSSFVDSTTNHSHNSSHRSENQSNHTHHQYLQQSKHNEDHNSLPLSTALLIAIPIIILVLILAIVLLVIFMVRRRQSNSSKNNPGRRDDRIADKKSILMMAHTTANITESPDLRNGFVSLGGGGDSSRLSSSRRSRGVQVFTYKELEMATDNFNEGNVVGNGGYGVVYKGALKDGTLVAIKMLHRERKQGERAFRTEVDLLSRLHSPHLVELLGYCADQNHRLLVFEFMTNGSLQNHLQKPSSSLSSTQSSLLDWRTRLRIALDCARALEYLHEHASIIHRDFKCSNVLLDHNLRAKVSDFGLAKMGSEKINGQISTRVLGTTGYLAPEYVSTGKLTTKSDVYSYGVVLLQLITGRVPVDTKRPPGEHVLVSWALPRLTNREKVIEMVDPDIKGQCSKKELVQVAAIAAVCVQAEADYRPLMTDVVQSLVPLAKNFSSVPSKSARFYNHLNSASL